ncbi:hypothetical protein LINPERHAP1_LOCUS20057 [Linum perenne]
MESGPWSFDQNLLVMRELKEGELPHEVDLHYADFWVQMHQMPRGFCSEAVGTALGNYVGKCVKYDDRTIPTNDDFFMRARVTVDIRRPLKREKKVKLAGGVTGTCKFRYERLPNFCYICGKIGHIDRYCEVRFHVPEDKIVKLWDETLRAPPKKERVFEGEKWLDRREVRGGGSNSGQWRSEQGRGGGGTGGVAGEGGSGGRRLPRGVAALLDNLGASEETRLTFVESEKVTMEEENRELVVNDERKRRRGGGIELMDGVEFTGGKMSKSPKKSNGNSKAGEAAGCGSATCHAS